MLSKRPELFLPEQWPAYYSKAKGAEVWDLDGNRYLDATISGVSTSTLGFADPDVEKAVIEAVQAGPMSTLNTPDEVELAELLIELHPWADMVRYGRCGGEMMAVAVRIARAAAGRSKIAFCGYHGWHDWYLAANLAGEETLTEHLLPGLDPAGVPRELTGTMLPFRYNRIDELRTIADEHGREIGVIVMEPVRGQDPQPGFLEEVRSIADRIGAVLIFDEVTSGMRMNTGGVHMTYGVEPDLAVFAKAIANGFAMAAVIGRRSVMEAAQTTFISSTAWTERIGPAAALATIRKHRREDVPKRLVETGLRIREGWHAAAEKCGLRINTSGLPPIGTFSLAYDRPLELMTLFIQEMLDRRILASAQFSVTYAHHDRHIERYIEAVNEVFPILSEAAKKGDVLERLRGPVKHGTFTRLT